MANTPFGRPYGPFGSGGSGLSGPLTDSDWDTNPEIETPALRARSLTREQWRREAIQLAWQARMIGKLYHTHSDEAGRVVFVAPSVTRPTMHHEVTVDLNHRSVSCTCEHGRHNLPCPHIGALWHHFHQLAAHIAPEIIPEMQTGPLPSPLRMPFSPPTSGRLPS